jgi:hypothetical protein
MPVTEMRGGKRSGAGRPAGRSGRRLDVMLDADLIDAARRVANGNVSAGIRYALTQTVESPDGRLSERGRRVVVYLDEASIQAASVLGGGNIAAGIRAALRTLQC